MSLFLRILALTAFIGYIVTQEFQFTILGWIVLGIANQEDIKDTLKRLEG